MEVTEPLRTRLRKLLNESIPPGGTEADTKFSDQDINMILIEADSFYAAVTNGWMEKAGMLQGDIESYSIGSEKYDLTSLKDLLAHALAMAKQYGATAEGQKTSASYGSYIFGVRPPEVL